MQNLCSSTQTIIINDSPTLQLLYTQIMSFSSLILMPNWPKWPQRGGKRILRRRKLICLLIFSYAWNFSLTMSTSYSKCVWSRMRTCWYITCMKYYRFLYFSLCNRHAMTKHQYYLQLRKDILEEMMRCDTENAMILASLALQAEFGNYQPEVLNDNFNHWITCWLFSWLIIYSTWSESSAHYIFLELKVMSSNCFVPPFNS